MRTLTKRVWMFGATLVLALLMIVPASAAHAQDAAPHGDMPPAQQANNGANSKPQTVLNETDAYRKSAAVTKMGAMLGMSADTAANVFTIFNLVILFGALGYGLAKALPKAFKARSTAIQKNLVEARTATEEASARLNSVESRLAKLDEQIAAMRTHAEADAKREERRIKDSIDEEKLKIVAAAEAEIQAATTQARRSIQSYAAELAVEQAARKLVISADTDKMLVQGFAARLGEGSKN